MWQTPKTNWIADDEYNAADINRVESNTLHVRDYLESSDYPVPTITAVTNRAESDYDTVSSINRIETNIEALRLSFTTPPDWQPTITWTYTTPMTADIANRWEQSVASLYALAQQAQAGYRYCGTFLSGQGVTLP